VHRVRELGKISFLLLRDRSGLAQCVVDGKSEVTPEDAASPHGGLAIGLERLTQKVLGLSNVKEACLFPRDRKRVRP
jgi:aspartyl/asparaginyl-tRNA synthetase